MKARVHHPVMPPIGRWLAWAIAVAFTPLGLLGAALPDLAWNGSPTGPITVPLFGPRNGPPAVVVQIDSVHLEYQRKGFFRIGVLPITVAEGVNVELREAEGLPEALAALPRTFAGRRMGALEGRRFTLSFPREQAARLRADRVTFQANGRVTLHSGRWIGTDGRPTTFKKGTLEGCDRAEVWLKTDAGRWRLN